MTVPASAERYGAVARALHWSMFLLIAAMCLAVEARGWLPKESATRASLMFFHKSCGVAVFALVWVRLAWRAMHPAPKLPAGPAWQHFAAHAGHVALYLLMIGLPLTGYLTSAYAGRAVPFFGLFELPLAVGPDEALGHTVKEFHEAGATVLYVVVAVHVGAALWHHFVQKDTVLTRMLPQRS